MATTIEVGVEAGAKRAFAAAFDWPGWCRGGRPDEAAALEALWAYRTRYASVMDAAGIAFPSPEGLGAFHVAQRVTGNATTDYGAPDGSFDDDARSVDGRNLPRLLRVLDATWDAFDRAVESARGIELRKGPRGGGRELDAIVDHVVQAEAGYASRLGARLRLTDEDPWVARSDEREGIHEALTAAVVEGLPESGPRGGTIWTPRRFLRRAAWHVLDHAWEIEDRA